MDTKRLAEWAEIIGGAVVVISLAYVGYQVKQNTKAIEADTLNSVVSGLNDLFTIPMDREIAELMVRAKNDPDSFTDSDNEQFLGVWAKHAATYEMAWIHKESGLLPKEYWETMIVHQCLIYGSPVGTALWFKWQEGLTTGYWDEITRRCELSKA